MASRLAIWAATTAAFSVVVNGWHGVAFAEQQGDDGDPAVILEVTTISNAQLMTSIEENGDLADSFMLEQARAGLSVDFEGLTTAVTDGLEVVWESSEIIEEIVVVNAVAVDDPEDSAQGIEFQSHENAAAEEPHLPPPVLSGAGLQATKIGGADFISGGCLSAENSRGRLTYCQHKYKIKETNTTYDYYFYDRWATAKGFSGTPRPNIPTKIDIRSRPKSSGSNINGFSDYAPRTAITSCTQAANVGISFLGFSASIPMSECKDISPDPNATTRTMRVVYDQGAIFSGQTHGVEMGVVFRTSQGKSAQAAHYNYVKFCKGTYLSCSELTRTQNGW